MESFEFIIIDYYSIAFFKFGIFVVCLFHHCWDATVKSKDTHLCGLFTFLQNNQ